MNERRIYICCCLFRSAAAGLQVADGLVERDLREPVERPRHALRAGTEPRHALAGLCPQARRSGPRAAQHLPEPVPRDAGEFRQNLSRFFLPLSTIRCRGKFFLKVKVDFPGFIVMVERFFIKYIQLKKI